MMRTAQTSHYETSRSRSIFLFLTILTGLSALIYEVIWQRYLANLLGSNSQATATVLAVFLGGLSLGYALFGRISDNRSPRSLTSILGWAEVGIGAWALLFPELYLFLRNQSGLIEPVGSTFSDGLYGVILIGVPTILMGGTIPLLTQALATSVHDSQRLHAQLYTLNTAGAFVGCLISGFYLIPTFGLPLALYFAALINLSAGFALIGLSHRLSRSIAAPPPQSAPGAAANHDNKELPTQRCIAIALLAGFYSITLQTVFIRIAGLSMGASEYTFAMVVSIFILMLALGASLLTRKTSRATLFGNQLLLFFSTLALHQTIPYWPSAVHKVRVLFTPLPSSFYLYHLVLFLALTAVLAIPIGCMGRTLPLLFSYSPLTFERLGKYVGVIYSSNTLGCVLGAYLGGFVLLYHLSLDELFQISLFLIMCNVVLVLPQKAGQRKRFVAQSLAGLTVGVALLVMISPWNNQWFAVGLFRQRQATPTTFLDAEKIHQNLFNNRTLLAYEDGPNTTVAVTESPDPTHSPLNTARSIFVNGKSDGATSRGDRTTTLLLGHLPSLLQRSDNQQAAVIGFGTGITVGAIAQHDRIESINCMEISPVVQQFAHFFDDYNGQASTHPKLKWSIADAYRVLSNSPEQYAVIVSEPSNPWVTGVEKLYSQDFYQLVSDKLAPGGIYAQWLHIYDMSVDTIGMVLNTYHSVFPHVRVFSGGGDIILLGSQHPIEQSHLGNLSQHINDTSSPLSLPEVGFTSVAQLLAREAWWPLEVFAQSGYHTLDVPKLAYQAGKSFFMGQQSEINELMTSDPIRQLTHRQGNQSLLLTWLRSRPPEQAVSELRNAIPGLCGKPLSDLPADWESLNLRCRQALVALISNKALSPRGRLSVKEQAILNYLDNSDKTTLEATGLLKDRRQLATVAIDVFQSYHSPFLSLYPTRLIQAASWCYEDKNDERYLCRSRLIEALAFGDFDTEVKRELSALRQDYPQRTGQPRDQQLEQVAQPGIFNLNNSGG
jgi:spermidine synthase/MFS family permease